MSKKKEEVRLSRSAPQQQQQTRHLTKRYSPEESEEPWKGSNFCRLAFGGPSTKWSAMVKSRCYLLFTKPKPKHWPNATANRSHCTVIHYLPRFVRQTHGLYRKIRHKWHQTVDVRGVREPMHLSRHIFLGTTVNHRPSRTSTSPTGRLYSSHHLSSKQHNDLKLDQSQLHTFAHFFNKHKSSCTCNPLPNTVLDGKKYL